MRLPSFATIPVMALAACSSGSTTGTTSTYQPDKPATASGGAASPDGGPQAPGAAGTGAVATVAGSSGTAGATASGAVGGGNANGAGATSGGVGGATSGAAPGAGASNGGFEAGGAISSGGSGGAGASGGGSAGMSGGGATSSASGGAPSGGVSSGGGATASGGATATGTGTGGGSAAGASSGGTAGNTSAGGASGACGGLTTKLLTQGLENPVYATAPPGDSRLFILERTAGRISIVDAAGKNVSTFLDISSKINAAGFEAGLLSLAFHPGFAHNGAFYVTYTTASVLRVSRFLAPSADANAADPGSEAVVIEVPQTSHHNTSGMVLFGPDGDLYVGVGDGDDKTTPQDLTSLNGKMLRLAVDPSAPSYTIPAGNPFVGKSNARPEIWAYGLREPYRYWFDGTTNALYIADVGASSWEEIDVVSIGKGGLNFGWPIMEGTHCFSPSSGCPTTGLTMPVYDFAHTGAETAVIGGGVYRGTALPACYRGKYFFGTYNSGVVDTLSMQGATASVAVVPGLSDPDAASFGQDGNGELLIIDSDQNVSRIVAQ
jgi:glucose/arabinose dehydrogenase